MHRLLRVADIANGVFLTMPAALAPLRPDANALRWSILDLGEAVATDESGLDLLDLERRVFESPSGLSFSFDELSRFAACTRQVIDGLFVARMDASRPIERGDDDLTILRDAEIVLAEFDSTFWLVSAPDEVLRRFETAFHDVTEEDPTSTALRAWGAVATAG